MKQVVRAQYRAVIKAGTTEEQLKEAVEQSSKKMQEMIGGGTTVLFVSHSISQIRKLCDRVIWLEHGKMIMDGEPEEVCNKYLQSQKEK